MRTTPRTSSSASVGRPDITGHQGHWTINAVTYGSSQQPLRDASDFTIDPDVAGTGSGSRALLSLDDKVDIPIDILARRRRAVRRSRDPSTRRPSTIGRRESMVEAFIRDPRRGDDLVQTAGLSPRGEPAFAEPPIEAHAPAECAPGRRPRGGHARSSASRPTSRTSRTRGGPLALVTRTGGSSRCRERDGSRPATTRRSPAPTTRRSAPRSASTTATARRGSSRSRSCPTSRQSEPETFDVSLTGRRTARRRATSPPPRSRSSTTNAEPRRAGDASPSRGTVSGLEGSGLVLANLGTPTRRWRRTEPSSSRSRMPDAIPVSRDGGRREPTEPGQVVHGGQRGGHRSSGADVTDVVVECVTPPPRHRPRPRIRRRTGRLSTCGPADAGEAIAVQPDGHDRHRGRQQRLQPSPATSPTETRDREPSAAVTASSPRTSA